MNTQIYILGRALVSAYLRHDKERFQYLTENNLSDFFIHRIGIDDIYDLNENIAGCEIMLVLNGTEIQQFEKVTGYIIQYANDNN